MSVERVIANMLRLAAEDLDAAVILASKGNRFAIYHHEQAAEKIIRAVLTSEGEQAGRDHQLESMVDKVPDANPIKLALRNIEYLAAYATTYRYPTPTGRITAPPNQQVLESATAKVRAALDQAASGFEVDLTKPDTPARRPVPLR